MNAPIYTLRCKDPRQHLWQVRITVEQPAPDGQRLRLPVWIPGSYLVREYARHVVSVSAHCGGEPISVNKVDKQTWQAAPCAGTLHVDFTFYAHDESVRGAWVDDRRAYFNGAAILPWVEGQEHGPQRLRIERIEDACAAGWKVATTMTAEDIDADGYGSYSAADYDELIDHPVEIAAWQAVEFEACGTPHRIVLSGEFAGVDLARLAADVRKVCAWQIGLFGGTAPFDHYDFLTLATRGGYGGLEHRASTSLIVQRDHLPRAHGHDDKGYRTLLGLFSHEYFHSWLVKRIKPADFAPYDLSRENLTRQLWLFEGFTSYYDDLALLRSGVIDAATYLKLLAETISRVHGMPGHRVQTLEDASLDAWIKYYRPDENSPNATVSYYAKGALVALSLDLHLRKETAGRVTLDQVTLDPITLDAVMQALWAKHASAPLHDGDFEALAEAVSGIELAGWFERALRSTEPLPLHEQLPAFGIDWQWRVGESDERADTVTLGAKFESKGAARVRTLLPGGPAQRAGLAPGDEVVALDGWRVDAATLPGVLKTLAPGVAVSLHSARDGRLRTGEIVPVAPEPDTCVLKLAEAGAAGVSETALGLRKSWLGA
ncbi:MAG: M61 family metallopeptidase [Rhodocyclaceae bacterium]|nr:M61 family metallopeptidase [Rhodocyclaceae bacterium]